jgi:putative transposase
MTVDRPQRLFAGARDPAGVGAVPVRQPRVRAKYDKTAACLAKDREALLTLYDFPAEHWKHVRTANPIESTFATVRLRTTRTEGCPSRRMALTMVFRLCQSAQQRWRRLDGPGRLAEVVRGVRFVDGERRIPDAA